MTKRAARGVVRIEEDTLGQIEVPEEALYGAQTARAVENFTVSGWRLPAGFLSALAYIKAAFARANGERGLLPVEIAGAVTAVAEEVANGAYLDQFPVDVFQTGSGTSTNMNMNEVLAHLATATLTQYPARHVRVHPNDHVNLGQSSNDAIPTALRIAAAVAWRDRVRPALTAAVLELRRMAGEHQSTVTLGRTHLMDAVPTTYGRVFGAWAERLEAARERVDAAARGLLVLPLGGTAVGTGINSDLAVVARAAELVAQSTGLAVALSQNPAVEIAAQDAPIAYADALADVGRVMFSLASDIRLRASGPFGGFAELLLPAVQPGSSIMPGKVNPVIPEAVVQVAIEVEGLAAACRASIVLHQLDLSHANPLLAWNLDTMAALLAGGCDILVARCLSGLRVNTDRARHLAAASPALVTALAARIGYDRAAEVAKAAEGAGATVIDTALRLGVLAEAELVQVLNLARMAGAEE